MKPEEKIHCPNCEDQGELLGEQCKECCPHDEYDHYICLGCGHEKCPGEDIDAAMDSMDMER